MESSIKLILAEGEDVRQEFIISPKGAILGRGKSAQVFVHDSTVSARHCRLKADDGQWVVTDLHTNGGTFVNDQKVEEVPVKPGDTIRIGHSQFTIAAAKGREAPAAAESHGFIAGLMDRIAEFAGIESIQGFSFSEMFSEIFRKRTEREVEDYLIVGTESTTPAINQVPTGWPKPWLFFKTLALVGIVYLGFVLAFYQFSNTNLIPGLIMMGSFAVPLALLLFFFEVNVWRNVSIYQMMRLFLLGSIVSLFITLVGYRMTNMDTWLGPLGVAVIEETGKAATLLIMVNKVRYRWTLNGLLFGATVGAGFAVFESAGYALNIALSPAGISGMLDNIVVRGTLEVFGGHILWCGLVGAALWRIRGDRPFNLGMLKDGRFLRAFGFAVGMHAIWDWSRLDLPYWGKYIILGFIAWAVVLAYISNGLKQVRDTVRASEVPRLAA